MTAHNRGDFQKGQPSSLNSWRTAAEHEQVWESHTSVIKQVRKLQNVEQKYAEKCPNNFKKKQVEKL